MKLPRVRFCHKKKPQNVGYNMTSKNNREELNLRQKSKYITYIPVRTQRRILFCPVKGKFQKTLYENATNDQRKSEIWRYTGRLSAE